MGTPELLHHMSRHGTFVCTQKLQFKDNQAWNEVAVTQGNPKVPYMPLGMTNNANPRLANARTAAFYRDVTARQLWANNNAANPGINPGVANIPPKLINPHEMRRLGMTVNTTNLGRKVSNREAEAVAASASSSAIGLPRRARFPPRKRVK